MTKNEARIQAKRERAQFEPEEITIMQLEIENHFKSIVLPVFNYLQTYIPISNSGEVDPVGIVNFIRHHYPNLMISVPKILDSGSMESVLINDEIDFEKNMFGILEPIGSSRIDPIMLDIILIPLLSFDQYGNRIGFGKGFYDRFLKKCRTDVIKIGLSFLGPVENISDINSYDVPLDYCITPKKIYAFQ